MKNKRGWAVGIGIMAWLALGATGCGSDDGDSPASATTACEAYCKKEKDCDATISVEECILYSCSNLEKTPPACQNALRAFYDCMNKAADICDTASCTAQETAYHEAC